MAMTKTVTLKFFEVHPKEIADAETNTNAGNPTVHVFYNVTVDDPSDDELPVRNSKSYQIARYSDEENQTATDVSGEDPLVQDVCAAIWS